jgi:hypothetical protein
MAAAIPAGPGSGLRRLQVELAGVHHGVVTLDHHRAGEADGAVATGVETVHVQFNAQVGVAADGAAFAEHGAAGKPGGKVFHHHAADHIAQRFSPACVVAEIDLVARAWR